MSADNVGNQSDHGDGDSATSNHGYSPSGPAQEERTVLARKETKAVSWVRILVFGVLLCGMAVVGILVFYQLKGDERKSFLDQYREHSAKVLTSIKTSFEMTLGELDALVVSILSVTSETNQTWPFVTVPDFAVRAAKTRSLTWALFIGMYTYVDRKHRSAWEEYTAVQGSLWLEHGLKLQQEEGILTDVNGNVTIADVSPLWNVIRDYSESDGSEWGAAIDPSVPGPFFPSWQTAPVRLVDGLALYNWNGLSGPMNDTLLSVHDTHKVSVSQVQMIANSDDPALLAEIEAMGEWFGPFLTTGEDPKEPLSHVHYPILVDGSSRIQMMKDDESYNPSEHQLAGVMLASFYWRDLIKGILPDGSIVVVFDNPCNPSFTYQINGQTVTYLGAGDHHETKFDYLELKSPIHDLMTNNDTLGYSYTGLPLNKDFCPSTVRVYPSSIMEDEYMTPEPAMVTMTVILIFIVTALVFVLYDACVEKRQRIVMHSATRSDAIVSALFPSNVRDRLMNEETQQKPKDEALQTSADSQLSDDIDSSPPIADLFPEATVIYADLAGFTAWSSSRDPTQVFTLLETLYGAYDTAARRRGVFKVETVGDCYVAVVGLPEPRKNHAVVMCRFAAEILEITNRLTTELELSLGPGTGDLCLRCGLHSGGVTAGVLRGDKGRFQLFGDTVNNAARIESNGKPGRIHVSQETADLLIAAGKGQWLEKREDLLVANEKAEIQTYWVEPNVRSPTDLPSDSTSGEVTLTLDEPRSSENTRLIDWTQSVFENSLRKLSTYRSALGVDPSYNIANSAPNTAPEEAFATSGATDSYPREEVVTSIHIPAFQKKSDIDPETVPLPHVVVQQLSDYLSTIAQLYHSCNPFHNFAHACHVTMSTKNLLQRIITHSNSLSEQEKYYHSFGLSSDALAEVAMIFSALIHDVDHPGVSNRQLIEENHAMATRYRNKSVAEQNSVNIAWSLLMEDRYPDLRAHLFASPSEHRRFRQLVVNAVIATDVFDPDLTAMRDRQWELAFSESVQSDDPDALNRKATIVLEHLSQASDVSHTMQHWAIYQKWNRNLFREMYGAYQAGRGLEDPSVGWFDGELWFFDNYILPLARKLIDCQVFGATAQCMLDCANENRREWESKGRVIVQEMKDDFAKEQVARHDV